MSEPKRIVIVGGVAGGASAATRLRRLSESAEILLLERGEHVSFANCGLPYHIGGTIAERERLLVQTPQALRNRYRLDVRIRTEAIKIDRENKKIIVRQFDSDKEEEISYDTLILSPGAEPVRLPIPGADSTRVFTLRNMADMDAIKKVVDRERTSRAVVIGGGYIGLEMAEALTEREVKVSLVEVTDQVMGPADPEIAAYLHQHLKMHGVDLRLKTAVKAIVDTEDGISVKLSDGEEIACGLVVMAVGVKPDIKIAKESGLKLGERGGIWVDERMRTSDPDIYAVGDAVEVTDFKGGFSTLIPLAGPANRQGRIAATNAMGGNAIYKHTQGTAICKVFDLAVGMTGLSEKTLKRLGQPYEKIYIHPNSHAGYYPEAYPIALKLLFEPSDGSIWGAQAVGMDGVDKRIDVLATAVRNQLTVFDLEDLELAYAPPFGSAKDPINYAGFVAANVIEGADKIIHAEKLNLLDSNQVLLDVRNSDEVKNGTIKGAINIPLDVLRDRLNELPRDREILVFCQVGLRGYLACRILMQHGYKCRNLSGGYATYQAVTGQLPDLSSLLNKSCGDSGEEICAPEKTAPESFPAALKTINACGLACPGPIMRLAKEMEALSPGQTLEITATDPGFISDIPSWCTSTGNLCLQLAQEKRHFRALIKKGKSASKSSSPSSSADAKGHKTLVVFSQDFDRVMAAFIIANGAAAMGSKVTMFFTFWGLNVLRREGLTAAGKDPMEKMFGKMMPQGVKRLKLSKLNMGGLGTAMMKMVMNRKQVTPLASLMESAQQAGVRLVACSMSMDIMGIKKEELLPGVEEGGVAMYLGEAEKGNVNLFI